MLEKGNIQDIFILSPMQEAMFFHSLYEPDAVTYFEQACFRQHGLLHIDLVEQSFNMLLARYEVLRAVFIQKGTNRPLQVILKKRDIDFNFEDIRELKDKDAWMATYKQKDKERNFNLSKDVLMRVSVIQLGTAEFEIIWSWHHILIDAWCVSVLQTDFVQIYEGLLSASPLQLPAVKPYKSYIDWLIRQDPKVAADYWRQYLSGYTAFNNSVAPVRESVIEQEEILLSAAATQQLSAIAAKYKVTLNSIVKSLWGILLSFYHQQQDVVFGTIVSGRPSAIGGIESMVGLFINTIPVRIQYDDETTFSTLIKRVQQDAMESEPYHYLSLSELLTSAGQPKTLIDHIFLFQNFPGTISNDTRESGTAADDNDSLDLLPTGVSQDFFYDLNVFAIPGNNFQLIIKYNRNRFEQKYIAALLQHFSHICAQVIADNEISLDRLTLLTAEETALIRLKGQGAAVTYKPAGVKELFEATAVQYAASTALLYNGSRISYANLNNQSNGLALWLTDQFNIGPGSCVAIMMPRSEKMIISLMAILKAGAIFLPVDPALPGERKKYMLATAKTSLLLTVSDYLLDISDYYDGQIFAADIELDSILPCNTNPTTDSDDAYILYTSGSTGRPKGVAVGMESFSNYLQWANRFYFDDTGGKDCAFFTPLSFDLTLTSIFSTLLRGDTLHIFEEKDTAVLLEELFTNPAIIAVKLTPAHISLLKSLPVSTTAVRYAIVGGEALTDSHVRTLKALNPAMRVFNEYGPTEATIGCTVKEITAEVTIGKPIDNTAVYIMDAHMRLLPEGMKGELYVGGKALAKGYAGNEALTAERFIGGMYKTGDIAQWQPDGDLVCFGRLDEQVKIRGYRVEPEEIAAALKQLPGISDAIVIPSTDDNNEQYLTAYYIATAEVRELRAALSSSLPAYMLPAYFIQLSAFPLTVNGKIKKDELPHPFSIVAPEEIILPRNATEERLLEIWKEVLHRDVISMKDKFFDIGAHSLNAAQVVAMIYQLLHVRIELKDMLDAETIENLAVIIADAPTITARIVPVPEQPYYGLSHAQKRLWTDDKMQEKALSYIIPKAFLLQGDLNIPAMEQSFQTLLERHESLRTIFSLVDGKPLQQILALNACGFRLEYHELLTEAQTEQLMKAESETPFNLQTGPLLRAKLIKTAENNYVFLLTLHHIISDGRSMEVFIREIITLYNAYSKGEPVYLEPLRIQYKDYAAWQARFLSGPGMRITKDFWKEQLKELPAVLQLPSDYVRPARRTFNGDSVFLELDAPAFEKIKAVSSAGNTTLFATLLSALNALLYVYTQQGDVTIGTVETGRIHPDLEDQIGFYMNMLALRTRFEGTDTFTDLLKKNKTVVENALKHQHYPYDLLLEEMAVKTDSGHFPLFDIVLSLQYNAGKGSSEEMQGVAVSGYSVKKRSALFDLTLDITATDENLYIDFIYNTDIFKRERIELFGERYKRILTALALDPDMQLADIRLGAETVHKTIAVAAKLDFDFKY